MSQKNIDNHFKNSLQEYVSKVDNEVLWDSIENRVPKKKRKRRFFLWLSFGALFGVFVWYSLPGGSEKPIPTVENELLAEDLKIFSGEGEEFDANRNDEIIKLIGSEVRVLEVQDIKPSRSEIQLSKRVENTVFKFDDGSNLDSKYSETFKHPHETQNDVTYLQRKATAHFDLLPLIQKEELKYSVDEVEIPRHMRLKKKRTKPVKVKRSFVELSYFTGVPVSDFVQSSSDTKVIDYGNPYFSQGLSLSYNKYLNSRIYGRVLISADKSYKRYMDAIQRDTLVETSAGEQIISYNEYVNGVVDSESGIPVVNAVYSRDVTNLNSITAISLGIGIGISQPVGRINFKVEADIQRSFYHSISGLGREGDEQRIKDLNTKRDYFSNQHKIIVNTQLKTEYGLSSTLSLTGGIQYQMGRTSLLNEQEGNSENLDLYRFSLGLKHWIK